MESVEEDWKNDSKGKRIAHAEGTGHSVSNLLMDREVGTESHRHFSSGKGYIDYNDFAKYGMRIAERAFGSRPQGLLERVVGGYVCRAFGTFGRPLELDPRSDFVPTPFLALL